MSAAVDVCGCSLRVYGWHTANRAGEEVIRISFSE
jgi:hypothetical protein